MTEAAQAFSVLTMLRSIIREHETGSGSARLHVIPCLTDDLIGCIDVVAATTRNAGGVVLNTSTTRSVGESPGESEDFRGPVVGDPTPGWMASLQAALRITRLAGQMDVVVTRAVDRVDASYVPAPGSVTVDVGDPGDVVLAVARALCSTRLHNHELATLIYDEAELDADQRAALWALSQHLEGKTTATLRTLVVLVRASVQVPAHTGPQTGFRWALQAGELTHRNDPTSNQALINTIVDSNAPFVGLFLGAGFSASSGLRLGNELRDRAIERLGIAPPASSSVDLAIAFYRWVSGNGRLLPSEDGGRIPDLIGQLTLERVLREEYLSFSGEDPKTLRDFKVECDKALTHVGGAPRSLARLLSSGRKFVVCTVNFDELIEHTAGRDNVRVFSNETDFMGAPEHLKAYLEGAEPRPPVWKLHGTISDISSCIANDAVTLVGLSEAKEAALGALLSFDGARIPWVYVGASMRDTDLTPVLGRADFARALREYFVLPFSTPSVETFVHQHREERWRGERGYLERLITETADTFLTALADRSEEVG